MYMVTTWAAAYRGTNRASRGLTHPSMYNKNTSIASCDFIMHRTVCRKILQQQKYQHAARVCVVYVHTYVTLRTSILNPPATHGLHRVGILYSRRIFVFEMHVYVFFLKSQRGVNLRLRPTKAMNVRAGRRYHPGYVGHTIP